MSVDLIRLFAKSIWSIAVALFITMRSSVQGGLNIPPKGKQEKAQFVSDWMTITMETVAYSDNCLPLELHIYRTSPDKFQVQIPL